MRPTIPRLTRSHLTISTPRTVATVAFAISAVLGLAVVPSGAADDDGPSIALGMARRGTVESTTTLSGTVTHTGARSLFANGRSQRVDDTASGGPATSSPASSSPSSSSASATASTSANASTSASDDCSPASTTTTTPTTTVVPTTVVPTTTPSTTTTTAPPSTTTTTVPATTTTAPPATTTTVPSPARPSSPTAGSTGDCSAPDAPASGSTTPASSSPNRSAAPTGSTTPTASTPTASTPTGSTDPAAQSGSVLTRRVDVGTVVVPGAALWEIDGVPTVLLAGDGALYRTLQAGVDDGADVARLEGALAALGFTVGDALEVDEEFDAATTSAVEGWQTSLGVEVTGSVDPSDAVFLPSAVRVTGASVEIGDAVGSGSEILTVASVTPTMHVVAPVSGDGALTAGQRIELDIGDTATTGTVFAVSRDVDTDTDAGTSTVEVIVAFDDAAAVASVVDGTTVVATIVVAAEDGLTVPVGALRVDDQGRAVVTVVTATGDRDVVVTPGVSGGGAVVVSGALDEGDRVRLT